MNYQWNLYQNLKISDFKYFSGCDVHSAVTVGERVYTCTEGNAFGKINNSSVLRVYKRIFGEDATIDGKNNYMYTDSSKSSLYTINNDKNEWILHKAIGGDIGAYTYKRTIAQAEKYNEGIRIYEDIVIISPENKEIIDNILSDFKLNDDGMYTFFSREWLDLAK